ncbi:hypothetical protein ACIQMR_22980 [Streptomyces sp. NPDC091376]|uniref:hypothetical protein n=1 Tax=Streptomyces sp. NPDC091376 TaxID=3365994 RepID=UPI00382998EB
MVIAYPRCPSESVVGALVSVTAVGKGRGDGFETLWSARGPASAQVREGLFFIGSARSFAEEEKLLAGRLPDEFFVETQVLVDGHAEDGRDSPIDLAEVRSAQLADDEYVTWDGRVMTRGQINAQRKCGGT